MKTPHKLAAILAAVATLPGLTACSGMSTRGRLARPVEPLIAAVFAILLVGEQLAPIGWIGMILISICLALLTKAK